MLTMETIQKIANASEGLTPEQIETALAASKNADKLGDLKKLAAYIAQMGS